MKTFTYINKQLKAHIKQEISERAGYLYRELDHIIGWYHIEREDRVIDALDESVDRNLNEILLNRVISILEHYIEKKENLEALKGCYLEDEQSEEESTFLSESQEFEDSEITKI